MISALGDRHPVLEGDDHFIAPSASIIGSVRLKRGTSIWFNAVLRGDNELIEIGENCNIQDGAVLHADAGIPIQIGNNVTVGHQAMLHGCTIGDDTMIGIGSTLLNHARIGNNSIVGARSLVTKGKEFPDGVLILGSPARIVRDLRSDEIERVRISADDYLRFSRRFREQFGTD